MTEERTQEQWNQVIADLKKTWGMLSVDQKQWLLLQNFFGDQVDQPTNSIIAFDEGGRKLFQRIPPEKRIGTCEDHVLLELVRRGWKVEFSGQKQRSTLSKARASRDGIVIESDSMPESWGVVFLATVIGNY